MANVPVWGIHMDETVGTRPVDLNYVGIGWPNVGNLGVVPEDREAFKQKVQECYPVSKPGSIPVQAGVLYRFTYVIKVGDYVVYPSKVDRMVNIGQVTSQYRYDPNLDPSYPNMRSVEWLAHAPRDEFSQAALYEIGSFISLFSVRNYAAEFLTKAGAQAPVPSDTPQEVAGDNETITKAVSTQAQETTEDFVIRQLKSAIDPYEFEHFVAHLLTCMGYHTRVTQKSGDGGVDVIAHRDELGFEPPIIKVQCKQITSSIGRPEVSQLVGNLGAGEHGLFVTLGSYSREAREYGLSKPNLRLLDGEQLVELVFTHYGEFDPRYQALLPLRKIYVPSLEGAD
jgi:restriction system protein